MKKVFFTLVSVLMFAAASHAQGVLKFNKETHDFGKLTEGHWLLTILKLRILVLPQW